MINAARVLASRPRSKVAQDNMDVFRNAWENQVRILPDLSLVSTLNTEL